MLFHDSIIINTTPEIIFRFFEEIPQNYIYWHPDHLAFKWVSGTGVREGAVFYFEERIGGEFLSKRVVFTKVIPDQYLEFAPTNWLFRLFMPRISFEMKAINKHQTRFTAEFVVQGMGPIARWLNRKQFAAVRKHMQEEGENLKELVERNNIPTI